MEYKAEDFISFIEQGRRDKISPNALDLIAKRFRELERLVLPQADVIKSVCVHFDSCKKQEKYKAHCSVAGIHKCYEQTVL